MLPAVLRVFYFNMEPLKDSKALQTEATEGLVADRVEGKKCKVTLFIQCQ